MFAVCTKIFLFFSKISLGRLKSISILEILLGLDAICLVTSAVALLILRSNAFALIPIIVSILLAKPLATVSVGEIPGQDHYHRQVHPSKMNHLILNEYMKSGGRHFKLLLRSYYSNCLILISSYAII